MSKNKWPGHVSVLGVIVAALVALVLLSGPSTAAAWFASSNVAGGTLTSSSVDLATPNGASTVKTVDWSATAIQLTAPGATIAYGAVSAPAAVLKNVGPRDLFVEIGSVKYVTGPGNDTSDAQAQALAQSVKVSWAAIASGTACTAANFGAGLAVQSLNPLSASAPNTNQPVDTVGLSDARKITVNAEKSLCAKYELIDPAAIPVNAWGRGISVSYSWLGVDVASSWVTAPVVWTQKLQLNVPAPGIAAGQTRNCTASGSIATVRWSWPTAAGGVNPTGFDVYVNGTLRTNLDGSARSYALSASLLGGLFSTVTVTIVARVGSQVSTSTYATSVSFFLWGASC